MRIREREKEIERRRERDRNLEHTCNTVQQHFFFIFGVILLEIRVLCFG